MIRIITFLFLLSFGAVMAQANTGEMIKDIAFKTEKELVAKYGKPKKVAKEVGEDTTDEMTFLGEFSLTWTLKNNEIVKAVYQYGEFKKVISISVRNFKLNKDTFYKDLGWDKPILMDKKDEIIISGLRGMEVRFSKYSNYLSITVMTPNNIKTFGKKK